MPWSTLARRDGGGATSLSEDSAVAAATRLATSAWQAEQPARCCSNCCPLDVVEGVNGVRAGERVDVVAHEVTPNVSRSLMSPSRMRVFAVPSGKSSIVATSVWV